MQRVRESRAAAWPFARVWSPIDSEFRQMRGSDGLSRGAWNWKVMRFVTEQATYTLAGPPELRWGNLNWIWFWKVRRAGDNVPLV